MFKILIYGDLKQIQNVFGVYNSSINKVEMYSWLDLIQDIKFDGVKYLNLGLSKDSKIEFLDRINRIPPIRNKYNSKQHIYALYKVKNKDLVKYIIFPEVKVVTSSLTELVRYCDTYNVNRLNFNIRRHPSLSIVAFHKNGIPIIDRVEG